MGEVEVVKRLLEENELVPYASAFPPGQRWLVLAPHPDDETLGLGATLAAAVARGIQVTTVCLTSGDAQGVAAEREAEAVRAAMALGLAPPVFWRLPDRGLWAVRDQLTRKLVQLFAESGVDTVATPSPVELHPDHRAVAVAVHAAVRRHLIWGLRSRSLHWVAAYEVSAPLLPNVLVEVGATWERKQQALACYTSQLGYAPYAAVMEGWGTVRTLTLPGAERAEALFVLAARELARRGSRQWAALMGSPRMLALVPGVSPVKDTVGGKKTGK